jgi:hypothetical protein
MKTKLPFLLTILLLVGNAAQAAIILDDTNTTYEYYSGNGMADPNADGNGLGFTPEFNCYAMTAAQPDGVGALTYTIKVGAGIAKLIIRSYHSYLGREISGAFAVDGGTSQPLFTSKPNRIDNTAKPGVGVADDVIAGRYSLKTLDEPAGMVVRTLPSFLRLKPSTQYRIAFDTLADSGIYSLAVQGVSDRPETVRKTLAITKGASRVSDTFTTGPETGTFLVLTKSDKDGGKCVIDNLAIAEIGHAP